MDVDSAAFDPDKARMRKSEGTGLFTTFLNRSASSLTRSKSQEVKSRPRNDSRASQGLPSKGPAAHVSITPISRLPILTASTGTYQNPVSSSMFTPPTATLISHRPSTSSSQHASPRSPHPFARTSSSMRSGSSPTASRVVRAQSPPSASRPISPVPQSPAHARPNTIPMPPLSPPSAPSSSAAKRVLGILLPSSTSARRVSNSVDLGRGERKYHPRSGSGSSNEPLLSTNSRTSSERTRDFQTPFRPIPLSIVDSVSESQVSDAAQQRSSPQLAKVGRLATPTNATSRFNSTTPTSADKGKQRVLAHLRHMETVPVSAPVKLASPQARAPIAFLHSSIPRLNHIPPTPPRRKEMEDVSTRTPRRGTRSSPRTDSFMSDSMPIGPKEDMGGLVPPDPDVTLLSRHPAFALPPAAPMERSKSAPARGRDGKGRSSPCFRIPSPRFMNGNKENHSKERKVTPESVGSPIIRDTRMLPGEKNSTMARLSQKVRRTTHGSFDFERPGSRNSSKSVHSTSAHSDAKGTESKDEKRKEKAETKEKTANRFSLIGRDRNIKKKDYAVIRPDSPKLLISKTPSPIPPLPTTPGSRHAIRSRTRSPPHKAGTTTSSATDDDSALPRLSNSMNRRLGSRSTATHKSLTHPAFAFEPPRILHDVVENSFKTRQSSQKLSGPYVDTQTGLMWRRDAKRKENVSIIASCRSSQYRDGRISPGAMEEATAVIAALRDVLNDAGFSRLQTYVARFDAQIIPLEGPSGLIVRVQRLLQTCAPKVDERRKRQLLDTFIRVVSEGS